MPEPFTHPSPSPESAAAAAPLTGEDTLATDWTRTVVAFVDVVESVRLMQVDEAGTIRRWRRFVAEVAEHVLPATGGRLVKSLGDGMLLEFGSVPQAVAAAHAMHRRIRASDLPDSPDTALWLRVGVHVAQVVRDSLDLFGAGVNLGARIAAAAQPGEVLVSAEARAQLLPGLDGEIEDAGECYLKHIDGTHRLFRVSPPEPATAWRPTGARTSLRPTIGVAPMQPGAGGTPLPALAAALSDDLVAALAKVPHLLVVSRLSTAALIGRQLEAADLAQLLGVQYLVRCQLGVAGAWLDLRADIFEASSGQVVWQGGHRVAVGNLLGPGDPLPASLTRDITEALLKRQIDLAHQAALPTLAGYTLLLSAISHLHSLGRQDMARSRHMLEHLVDRHPRAPEARVWLAKWHFMQIAQVSSTDGGETAHRTQTLLDQVLEEEPSHTLALALSGHMAAYVHADLPLAERRLTQAVQSGPNESLAALFLAQVYVNTGRPEAAVQSVEQATALSPLDPLGYYYDLFAASAYSAAGHHAQALALTQRSLRQNTLHLSSWVQLIIEQVLVGQLEDARASAARYLVMRPTASVHRYLEHHAARELPLARRNADALLQAGLPW